jgi:uncharacterized protein (TIGR03000 family)
MLRNRVALALAITGLFLSAATVRSQTGEAPVSLTLLVPADARVQLDGTATTSTGTERRFTSPPVPVGQQYVYTIQVVANGKTVTRKVPVTPGEVSTVDLRSEFGSSQQIAGYLPSANGQTPKDQQVINSKATKRTAATSVNFRKQLGLSYASLTTLGSRIDAAHKAGDPVALAHAANELYVAEQVSGKQASVTSGAVLKEAAELAKLRRQVAELQAVNRVAQQMASEQDLVSNLRQQITEANQAAQAEQQAYQQNLEPNWSPRRVLVNNYTTQYVTIYINGQYQGEVTPGGQQTFVITQRWNPVYLSGYGDQDIDKWGPFTVWGQFKVYTWNLN